MDHRELKRKAVHISMVGFALLVGRLEPWLISLLCLVALGFNAFLLPALSGRVLERRDDRERGFSVGMLLYPAVLLALSLSFYDRQVFMVLAWGAMAFGDGFAGLVGGALGGPRLPWNKDKGWFGLLAFWLFGFALTALWLWLLPDHALLGLGWGVWLPALGLAMLAAGWVETLPGLIDDNLAVPLTAALVAAFGVAVDGVPVLPAQWPLGAGLVALLTVGSIASKKIDVPGGLVGGLLAALIFVGAGLAGLLLLFGFFVLGTVASRMGLREKTRMGLAQEDSGKRSVRHALANGGVAAMLGLMAWFFSERAELFGVMLAASLASAAADTAASELGNLYGSRYVDVLGFKAGVRGDDGVISPEGTALGCLAALIIASLYVAAGGPWSLGLLAAGAGCFGNLIDSILGATLQRGGYMTNDTVNFANTLSAALIVWAVMVI